MSKPTAVASSARNQPIDGDIIADLPLAGAPPVSAGTSECSRTMMLDAALGYAALDIHVLPLWPVNEDGTCTCSTRGKCSPGKHPLSRLVARGFRDATTDPATIREWWAMWPDAGIGIALEPSRLVVVGPDSPEWEQRFIERGLPDTATIESGGGDGHVHYYFARPPGCAIRRKCESNQYDILTAGYVVAAPTRHVSGRRYRTVVPIRRVDDLPLAPDWAVEELSDSKRASSPTRRQPTRRRSEDQRTEFGEAVREQFCDPSILPSILPLLNIPSDARVGGPGFLCPLGCGDERQSASLYRGANGVIILQSFHGCQGDRIWLLGEVYAGTLTREFRKLAAPELAVWSLRLLQRGRIVQPRSPKAPDLPSDLPPGARHIAEAFHEVLSLARGMGFDEIPFTRAFAVTWTGLSRNQVQRAWKCLHNRNIVTCARTHRGMNAPSLWTLR